jgi:hypothetical protein
MGPTLVTYRAQRGAPCSVWRGATRVGEDGAHPSNVSCSEGGSMFSVEGSHQGGRGWGPP